MLTLCSGPIWVWVGFGKCWKVSSVIRLHYTSQTKNVADVNAVLKGDSELILREMILGRPIIKRRVWAFREGEGKV